MDRAFPGIFIAFIFAASAVAQAQEVSFVIGIHGFAPECDTVLHVNHYVRGVLANPTGEQRLHFLGPTQFARARELGANMISTVPFPDSVVTSINPNVVRQICDSAAPAGHRQPLEVTLLDFGLDDLLAGERIMLHPESGLDFSERGDFEMSAGQQFDDLPFASCRLAAPLTVSNPVHRCVVIESGRGEIAGVVELRKRELSVFREWWSSGVQDTFATSGMYLLSVTVQLNSRLTASNSDKEILRVDVIAVNPADTTKRVTLSFPLREKQFFDHKGKLITHPIEIVLGGIQVRESRDTVVYIVKSDFANPAWTDTSLSRSEKLIRNSEYHNANVVSRKIDRLDIRVAAGTSTGEVFLDAVCLTSPRTFAMFYPNDPIIAYGGALEAWRWTRSKLDRRINALLTDGGKVGAVLPALRFIYGPEQGRRSAKWMQSSILQQLLDSASGGSVGLYCALGYSEDPEISAAFSSRFASGYYAYPIPADYVRPVYPDSTPGSYHHMLNRNNIRGFAEMAVRFRKHAENRRLYAVVHPWIPFVQNHSNLYESSIPSWFDRDPLREPTAAELRAQCNIPLAFGADGVMLYSFVSAPWITDASFWPPDKGFWTSDSIAGHQPLDRNAGTLGLLDRNLERRRCDWNGENKWDSTAAYIQNFLRPIGDTIRQHLTWQRAKIWHLQQLGDEGRNQWVSSVSSTRLGQPNVIDHPDSTFVVVSEFEHTTTGMQYLFVLNGRTHPTEGHRHVIVTLAPQKTNTPLRVINVLTQDMWIINPSENSDAINSANEFVDYFRPGEAALYRLEAAVEYQ